MLRRFFPSSLAGQIILVVAIAVFVAQAVNFGLLVRERERQKLVIAAAPAVGRIIDALERQASLGGAAPLPERISFSAAPPDRPGRRRPAIEQRAADMLADAGVPARAVRAIEQQRMRGPHDIRRDRNDRIRKMMGRRNLLHLSVEYAPGRWVTSLTRMPGDGPHFVGWLIAQTLVLYAVILIPLLIVARLIARPLRDLTRSAEQFASTGAADPVAERGPGDVRRLTTAFNAMRSRLLAMLSEKDRMLGAIGHDLRTPLASLRVRAESVEDDGERARMSETIHEMNRMLDDILSLARAGRSVEPLQKVDLAALTDAVVEDFIELGQKAELADSPRIVASIKPQQMKRALRNLIENAVEYGGAAEVALVRQDDGRLRIDVLDRGSGMPEERMAEMMEPFTRMEQSRSRDTGGAGLGLALVRAIMGEHGGELMLANRPEGGLRASLVLPASAAG